MDTANLLQARLSKLARALAIERELALHHVCSALSIHQMAAQRPSTLDEMAELDGWGYERCQMYGDEFLRAISSFCKEAGLDRASKPKRPRIAVDAEDLDESGLTCASCCFTLNRFDMNYCQLCGKPLRPAK